jgi:hypothetical protein
MVQAASRAVAEQGARAAFCLAEGGMQHQMERRNPMVARTTGLWFILLVGCASANRNTMIDNLADSARTPGMYFGHSQGGALVIAASHYEAMTGLATTADELGLPLRKGGNSDMLCQREMLTGTHLPTWTCRYQEDIEQQRRAARDWLDHPTVTLTQMRPAPTLSVSLRGGSGNRGTLPP